ncbi:SDR family oxidoreductase [Robiginitalea sp. SC105]|uniref:SDR family NAD(P)-dependent oxidoreductase n=1 Tax=Robiginitalea sp. SC105 TaxID=2762332 RepID=UPI001639AB0C|nr:SDR family NAD(P)-dependent oxidoreductase [Robiginitalea sp. SC105]MBC2839578.1 SDR family oxidoreductase [Robiginitalea sp. SC105]
MARIVVTGTSRGIGFELVQKWAASGHQVLGLSRNASPVAGLGLPGVTSRSFDITQQADSDRVAEWVKEHWGGVDILVHNAGSLVNKPFRDTGVEDFEAVYRVNVFGVAMLTRALLPLMEKEGHVLVISSMGGIQGSAKFPGLAAYSSSKGAVIILTELLAEEYAETGPSFNALALGAVQTEMLEAAFPGYKAPVSASDMAAYVAEFALTGHALFNGKVLQVSNSTP